MPPNGEQYVKAQQAYAEALRRARAYPQGVASAPLIWEAANAGGYAGGPEMQGTPVRAFREAVAEAEAADAHERRGVWAEMPREQNMTQAEAAVRAVVEATRNRMPDAIVSRRCAAPRHVAASRRRRAHRLTSSCAVCAQGVRGDHAARI